MKRLLFLGAGGALLFIFGGAGPASADAGPHISTASGINASVTVANAGAGRCASCHRTHTAKASMLLKQAQPALCYSCHGGGAGANTDVQNGTSLGGTALKALRGGGFEYALIGADAASKTMAATAASYGIPSINQNVPVGASEATTSKHSIDGVTSGTMWGNGAISATANVGKAAVKLECGSCHDPHGNGNYRILKPVPTDAAYVVTPAVVANPLAVPPVLAAAAVMSTTGVKIPDAAAKVYTTTNYWNVGDANVPKTTVATSDGTFADGYIANVSQWCATCHSRYMAKAPDYSTNSGDAVFTYRHTSGRTDKAGVGRPNCIQCHVSHGSNAAMTGYSANHTAPDGTTPARTSRLLRIDNRGTCVMCHNV